MDDKRTNTAEIRGLRLTFDGAAAVGLARAARGDLSPADLIVEYDDRYLFVSIVTADMGIASLRSAPLCESLARAFRDTFFYHSFTCPEPKPVELAALFAVDGVDETLIAALECELKRRIPASHPDWQADSALGCSILSVSRWKRRFGESSVEPAVSE